MPKLAHPRNGWMNHQPEGPTCWMCCVVAIIEFYKGSQLQGPPAGVVQTQYDDFMKWHASATVSAKYTEHALKMAGHFEDVVPLGATTPEGTVYNLVVQEIGNGRPLIFGVSRTGAKYGHAAVAYGYDAPNKCYIADPIVGLIEQTVPQLKSGYNGDNRYHWVKRWRTKP